MRAITPRAATALLALALVVADPAAVRSQPPAPDGFAVVSTKQLHTGVEYVKLAKSKVPVVAHVAHVLPGAPVQLQVVNAFDRISTRPSELETTSSMCERTKCIVGVNGDFHKFGVPAGAVIAGGRMLHSPEVDRPQLTVLKDGRLVAGTFPWTGAVTGPAGLHIAISTVNAPPPANELAVFTPEYGPETPGSARVELVVKAAGVGALNQPATMELVSLRTGAGPIPAGGAVLSGDGAAGQQLRDLWARRAGGGSAGLSITSPLDAEVSVGVEPVVLRDGKRALPWRDPNVINPRQPHTLVGWNREGHVYLIAVDGRQAASEGVTMAEAADFLVSLGVTEAVSLDGGGGTTFVAGGAVWNRPSDNDPARPGSYAERGATNAFVVMPRPGAPAPPAAPRAPADRPKSGVIKPMATSPDGDGEIGDGGDAESEPDNYGVGPTWLAGPTTVEGDAPLPAPGVEAPTGEPELHSAGPAGAAPPGRETAPGTAAPGEAAPEGRSPSTQARSRPERNGDRASSESGSPGTQLSLAAQGADSRPADRSGGRRGGPLQLIFAGSALAAALGLATRARAERRSPATVPPAEALLEPAILPVPEVHRQPEALVEPDVSPEPEVLVEPDSTPQPEALVEPDVSPEPEVLVEPDSTPQPEALVAATEPETSAEPELPTEPAVIPQLEATAERDVSPEPEPNPEPEATAEPEVLVAATEPDPTPEPEPTAEPEVLVAATEPEPTPEPEATVEPEVVAAATGPLVGEIGCDTGPAEIVEAPRVFELADLDGFYRLVIDHRARARIMANRLHVLRIESPPAPPQRSRSERHRALRDAVAPER